MPGYKFKLECLSINEQPRPKETPKAIDEQNENKNMPIPWNREDT